MALWSGWSLAVAALAVGTAAMRAVPLVSRVPLYVGTYTDGESRGIYRLEFDPTTAAFTPARLVAQAVNPTFLAWHPTRPWLLAVSETDTVGPDRSGGLLSYRVGDDGALTPIGQTSTGGAGACHLSVDRSGRHVLVANYGAGSVASFHLRADGGFGRASGVLQHAGAGPHPTRQTRPHAHAIAVAPGERFVIAVDLGTDALLIYRWNAARGTLTAHTTPFVKTSPGAGPRHVAFDPSGRYAFVINELDSTLTSYAWDGDAGTLTRRATVSTLPRGWSGDNTTAEVVVHPTGRVVYASNRGHDSIATVAVTDDGRLSVVDIQSSGGRTPRHFTLDASGSYLLAANQDSDSIAAFRVDAVSGTLVDTGTRAQVWSPVFVGLRPVPARP